MANWATTNYAIEGPMDILEKIKDAILHHQVEDCSAPEWEGNVLVALGIKWDRRDPHDALQNGKYMRGFIWGDPDISDGVLYFDAEEAWGATDFNEVLEENLHVKVYYCTEEPGCEVYETNDMEGKYFTDRYVVDACIHDDWINEYFQDKESAMKYIKVITGGRVTSEKELDKFNDMQEGDDFINLHEFNIV